MDGLQLQNLRNLLEKHLNFTTDLPMNIKKLSGGAIQENWAISGKLDQEDYEIVLRKNAATVVDASSGRQQEYELLKRLYELNICVPQPLLFEKKDNFLNSEFFVMNKISGVAEGHKLVRLNQPDLQCKILQDIGHKLAAIHLIESDPEIERIIQKPPKENYLNQLTEDLHEQLLKLREPRPILEFALSWMKQEQPETDDLVIVHGDYRTGNIMIDHDHVSGILDWEFTHWGDRREDIGWFTSKCWRFGKEAQVAGGIGSYKDFMQAYSQVSDIYIPEFELKFWHVLSHVRWAIIAIQQANRNLSNARPSLELALTAFLVPQLEKNILDIIGDKE
ncbi:phosphotransferase family protein [Acinetobacter pecorum]|nr:phosphotransferase family protein [Acinetobacter pecorum]